MNLYPEQARVADTIKRFFNKEIVVFKDTVMNNVYFLSGEVGSGKTYVGSYLVKHYLEQGKSCSVFCPPHMESKWKEVLESFGAKDVNISSKPKVLSEKADFIVWDEIHEGKPSAFKEIKGYKGLLLGLTGTAVGKDAGGIPKACKAVWGEDIFKNFKEGLALGNTLESFLRYAVKPFFSVGMTRENVSSTLQAEDAVVDYESIPVELSPAEIAFSTFLQIRLSRKDVSKRKRLQIHNSYFDYLQTKAGFFLKDNKRHFVGQAVAFHEAKLKRAKQLQTEIDSSKRVLWVTFHDKMAQDYANYLNLPFVDVSTGNPEQEVNSVLENQKSCVINVEHTMTGVDYHADVMVFLQVPRDIAEEAQTVGRITRLSYSSDSRTVYYLFHKIKLYEETIESFHHGKVTNSLLVEGSNKVEGIQTDTKKEQRKMLYGIEIID